MSESKEKAMDVTIDPSVATAILKTLRARCSGRRGVTIELSDHEYYAALDALAMQHFVIPSGSGFLFDGCTIQCSSRPCP